MLLFMSPSMYLSVHRYGIAAAAICLLASCSSTTEQALEIGSQQARQTSERGLWQCEANTVDAWRCRNLVTGVVAETATPEQSLAASLADNQTLTTEQDNEPAVIAAATAPAAKLQASATAESEISLYNQPKGAVVAQLLAARQEQTLRLYKQQHPALDTLTLQIVVEQQPMYLLVLGPFPSASAARKALAEIQPPLQGKPWIRQLQPLLPRLINTNTPPEPSK